MNRVMGEWALRRLFISIGALVTLGLAAHFAVLLFAQHDFTPVEALVALHANMLMHGGGLYYDLHHYPFTVSPYGPVFYGASAMLHGLGVPSYQSGRLISFGALLGALFLLWLGSRSVIVDRHARWIALVLAAATSNILFWGTVGQVDMLACCFSLAAFVAFLRYRQEPHVRYLTMSGAMVLAAVFTKQTALAAGFAIVVSLLLENRRTALRWLFAVAGIGGSIALALNIATSGRYFADAVLANMNPFSAVKLQEQAQYLLLTGSGPLLIALAAVRLQPLYLYAAAASGVWLVTASKVGSDLNYQVEMMLVLCLCAASALDRLQFFRKLVSRKRAWVTLLQIPLMLHLLLNLLLTARVVAERVLLEPQKRAETDALQPYVGRGRVLSVQYDSLVHFRGRIEVEPLIYTLLVDAGRSDPGPVLRDLAEKQFQAVILRENVFHPRPTWDNAETVALPLSHRNEIRRSYRLAQHIPGPYLDGVYVYQPLSDYVGERAAQLREPAVAQKEHQDRKHPELPQ